MRTAADMAGIIEALSERRTLVRFLVLCLAVNLAIWITTIVFADWVYAAMSRVLPDKIGIAILGIPLGAGMYATYCLLRLRSPTIEDNKHLDSEMMASFTYQAESTKRWFVWLIAVIGGVVNVLLLIRANMYFANEL